MSKLTPEFLASTHERIKNYDVFPHREVIVLLDEIDRLNAQRREDMDLMEETVEAQKLALATIEKLNAEAAAMREVLLSIMETVALEHSSSFSKIYKALSINAGRDMLERVRKLEAVAEAAECFFASCNDAEAGKFYDEVREALATLEAAEKEDE